MKISRVHVRVEAYKTYVRFTRGEIVGNITRERYIVSQGSMKRLIRALYNIEESADCGMQYSVVPGYSGLNMFFYP